MSRRRFLALGTAAGAASAVPALFSLVDSIAAPLPSSNSSLDGPWRMKLFQTGDDGTQLRKPGARIPDTQPAIVPGTVLTSLVANGAKDPYFGINRTTITDAFADSGLYTYWFLRNFRLPKLPPANGRVYLLLRGLNYSADVFLNGSPIAAGLKGQFIRRRLDVTEAVLKTGTNALAILVRPPSPAGDPNSDNPRNPPYPDGPAWPSSCQGGDDLLGESVTNQFAGGWDFVLSVPDRNTGLWDEVSLLITGPAILDSDPQITTSITWPANPQQNPSTANVLANVAIKNTAARSVNFKLTLSVSGHSSSFTGTLDPNANQTVPLAVTLPNPQLWWPQGQGAQPLYPAMVTLVADGVASDSYQCQVGLREISSAVDPITQGRLFTVNRRKVFVRGGNWCFPDAMLRHSAQNYDDQIRMHQLANLNLIRVWGGGIIERPEFFEACDKYGLMVWQEFPITEDCQHSLDNPDGDQPFLDCAADAIKMLRNHACLALWVGGNEAAPRDSLNDGLKALIAELDPKTDYVSYSTSSREGFGPGDGPYDIKDPKLFFAAGQNRVNGIAFNPEYGSVGFPVVESVRKFIPAQDLADMSKILVKQETFSELVPSWYWHHYQPFFSGVNTTPDQILLYGTPSDITAFCEQAQAAQYLQYKALFAGLNAFMWTDYTGGNLWRSQCGWPGMRGMLFDAYLEQTGGLFGARLSCAPISLQINLETYEVSVVNNTGTALPSGLRVAATFCDGTGALRSDLAQSLTTSQPVPPSSIQVVGTLAINQALAATQLLVVRTTLTDPSRKVLATNLDWIASPTVGVSKTPYAALRSLARTSLRLSGLGRTDSSGMATVTITAQNTNRTLSFFNRLRVWNFTRSTQTLPVFYSDNYFSVLPDETNTITLSFRRSGLLPPTITLDGWNSAGAPFNVVPVFWS